MIPWYAYALMSVIFATLFTILRKKALCHEHALNFESTRLLLNSVFCIFIIPFLDFNFDFKLLYLIYFNSFISAIGILLASKAFRHGEISLIAPLSNIKPAFVALIAVIFLGESLTLTQMIGIGVIFISAYVLQADHHFSNIIQPLKNLLKDKYSLYYIIAIFIFSIGSVFDKFFTGEMNIFTYGSLIWFFVTINLNVYHTYKHGFKEVIKCIKDEKFLVFFISFLSVVSWFLAIKAVSMTFVSLVTPILTLSTLFVVLLGGKFFNEQNLMFRLGIAVIMFIGTYLVVA